MRVRSFDGGFGAIWADLTQFWKDFSPESDPKMACLGPSWWSQSWCSTIYMKLRTWKLVWTLIWFIAIIIPKIYFLGQPILELWHFNFDWFGQKWQNFAKWAKLKLMLSKTGRARNLKLGINISHIIGNLYLKFQNSSSTGMVGDQQCL